MALFQSPGRDSGPSRTPAEILAAFLALVSIPWSGFRSFTDASHGPAVPRWLRFNPLVGIPVLHGPGRKVPRPGGGCFNPLVGIPVLHGPPTAICSRGSAVSIPWSGFRSFTEHRGSKGRYEAVEVSIPWSGFRSFTGCTAPARPCPPSGFNPLVGIPVLHGTGTGGLRFLCTVFQSPGRDSGPSRYFSCDRFLAMRMFQSPGRDSGPSRDAVIDAWLLRGYSFNPLVGIPVLHG